jgi:hypothetical protein
MNSEESRQAELDARLRRLHGGLDAGAGFEERVMRRVATVAATAPRENLRAQFELRRALLHRRLLREAWMSSITIAGIGASAFALLWRFAPDIQRAATGPSPLNDPNLLIGGTIAFLAGAIWFVFRRVRG